MSYENLGKIFDPVGIAVIGASDEEGTVGYRIMRNLIGVGYKGVVYPINIRKQSIQGIQAYPSVDKVPGEIDLAIIATPAATVPGILEECGRLGIKGIVIISAGFKEIGEKGRLLEQQIVEVKRKYDLTIVGPNCLGIIRPHIRLNASFANQMPIPGNIAFISQSGALCTSILDWAVHEKVGFSYFVSIGSMIDVDFGDLIDYFGTDPHTRSIIMYVEGLTNARKFMSAARHFARTKPILVVKSGKYAESSQAISSHTGSLAGEDDIYDAAFQRAGIVRVNEIEDLFSCAEVLSKQRNPKGARLAIITNAGGPGVMATDALVEYGGELAPISQEMIQELDQDLPHYWSRANPVDVLGDADADRYRVVTEACMRNRDIDGVLTILTPQGAADPADVARSIIDISRNSRKPILTSFMGAGAVAEANQLFAERGIPTYSTPEQAIETYMYMYQYTKRLELLYETPAELPLDLSPNFDHLHGLLQQVVADGRNILTEHESKEFLHAYGIPVVRTFICATADEAADKAEEIGYPVVLKILSPQIVHKTDVGGVLVGIEDEETLRAGFDTIVERAKAYDPKAEIQGVTLQKMVQTKGHEIIIGSKKDPLFGPVVLFGMGGIYVELLKDRAIGFPPLTQVLARRMMEQTKIYRLLQGYRNVPAANLQAIEEMLVAFSYLLVDFPQITELDLNPVLADAEDAIALDARIVIDRELVTKEVPAHSHLVISPYPRKYEKHVKAKDGRDVLLRPIKPEDEPLWLEMFRQFSEETIMSRFFEFIKDTPHEVRVRYCNIDYDREIAIVAESKEEGQRKLMGVVRLTLEPDGKSGEVAIVVADPWQGLGLGTKMMDFIIEVAKDKGLEAMHALIQRENYRSVNLFESKQFRMSLSGKVIRASLPLRTWEA